MPTTVCCEQSFSVVKHSTHQHENETVAAIVISQYHEREKKLNNLTGILLKGPWTCGGHYLIAWTDSRAMMQAAVCSVSRGPMMDPTSRAGRLWTCPIAAEARPPPRSSAAASPEVFPGGVFLINRVFGVWFFFKWQSVLLH